MEEHVQVLIIDDESAFAEIVAQELRSENCYHVAIADSGKEGIEQLSYGKFDAVFLDYRLGDITGLQVLEWMSEQKMETPVIMMTAAGSDEVAVEAMKLGAYDYVRKEHLELSHIPILVHGVHERFLFRKEKEAREAEEKEKERKQAALQMFQATVRTIAHHINNTLAVFMLKSSISERHLKKTLEPEKAEEILKTVHDLRRQAEIIEAIIRSLVEISNIAYTKYAGDQNIIDIRTQLEMHLQRLKERKLTSTVPAQK
ncbi:MAG: response regulator [Bacteroidota bacterium]|nr:response regulator [Bacteroidota bacterium]